MEGQYSSEDRDDLKLKFAKVFDANIWMLSSDLREVLLDDLVTAFENRVKVLRKIQSDVQIEMVGSVDCETVKT